MSEDYQAKFNSKLRATAGNFDGDAWAKLDSALTLGFIDETTGQRVPGFLETMSRHEGLFERSAIMDRWTLRGIAVIAVMRFLGINNLFDLVHAFGIK